MDTATDTAAIAWLEYDLRGQKCNGEKGLANHKHAAHQVHANPAAEALAEIGLKPKVFPHCRKLFTRRDTL
eukprot:1499281-Pyramimonas_sp.AAC.1